MNAKKVFVVFCSMLLFGATPLTGLAHEDPSVAAIDAARRHLINEVDPAVYSVKIHSRLLKGGNEKVFREGDGSGSAFGVTENGLVMLNMHLLRTKYAGLPEPVYTKPNTFTYSDGDVLRSTYTLTAKDGSTYAGEIVATDPENDLALLSIAKSALGKQFPYILFDTGSLEGDSVIAIGAPLGHPFTHAEGIVSHPARNVEGKTLVQTDAMIHPGNSGGPLVLLRNHKVVGVAVEVYTPPIWVPIAPNRAIPVEARFGVGIGFAIPAAIAKKFLEDTLRAIEADRAP